MGAPPYMPLYVDDYEAATAHLTLEEDGVYNRLLRLCWRSPGCSIPDDPAWIARRMRVDIETFHRLVVPIIREFFTTDKARVFQLRQRREFDRIIQTSDKRSEAGRKGGRPRKALKTNETGESPAKAKGKPGQSIQIHNQNQSLREEKGGDSAHQPQTLFEDFFDVWGDWIEENRRASEPIPRLLRDWQAAGLSHEEIIGIAVEAKRRRSVDAEPIRSAAYFDNIMQRAINAKAGMPGLPPTRRARPPSLVPVSAMLGKRVGS